MFNKIKNQLIREGSTECEVYEGFYKGIVKKNLKHSDCKHYYNLIFDNTLEYFISKEQYEKCKEMKKNKKEFL